MRVLVDTSIWSLALRRCEDGRNPEAAELRRLIAAHVVEIIGPIRQFVGPRGFGAPTPTS